MVVLYSRVILCTDIITQVSVFTINIDLSSIPALIQDTAVKRDPLKHNTGNI
jgi:hypothetical protein